MTGGRTPDRGHNGGPPAEQLVVELAGLVGGLAHELRNPLSTMMVNLKLLAEDLQSESADVSDVRRRAIRKVEELRKEGERLQSLFNDFLDLTDTFSLDRVERDINEVIRGLAGFFEPRARNQHVRVELDLHPGPLWCAVDERLLRQALLNVMINGTDAMPDGGTLRIATSSENGHVLICIADSGMGIREEDRDRILRPFFSTKARGTGLGLSITQRIIEEHGGSITFQSRPGKGATFTIRLPRRPAETPV